MKVAGSRAKSMRGMTSGVVTSKLKKMWLVVGIMMSTLLLTHCSLISPIKNENGVQYQLTTIPKVNLQKKHPLTLLISLPETTPIYDTPQIAYSTQPYQIAYFVKNRWAEKPIYMLQQLMIQTLHNTHFYRAVISSPFLGHYDYLLKTQLLELKQDFTENPSILRICLSAQMIENDTGRVLGERQFKINIPTSQNTPLGGVIAANQGIAKVLFNIATFCVGTTRF
jgi:cholesterol transport system auxiliary component